MEHSYTKHNYSWNVDPSNYFEEWFDEADDPVQFDHTAYFVEDLLDFAKDAYNDNRADLEYSTPKLTDISSYSEIGYVHKMRSNPINL